MKLKHEFFFSYALMLLKSKNVCFIHAWLWLPFHLLCYWCSLTWCDVGHVWIWDIISSHETYNMGRVPPWWKDNQQKVKALWISKVLPYDYLPKLLRDVKCWQHVNNWWCVLSLWGVIVLVWNIFVFVVFVIFRENCFVIFGVFVVFVSCFYWGRPFVVEVWMGPKNFKVEVAWFFLFLV